MNIQQTQIEKMAQAGQGIVFARAVSDAGISRGHLSSMVSDGRLERVGRGEYISPDAFDDAMFRLQRRYGRAVFSHGTALFLHGLSDRDPVKYTVTVPSGYNATKLKSFPATVFFINAELHGLGAIETTTEFGHKIRCYDRERAICDVVRSRRRSDVAEITASLKEYVRMADRDIPRLMRYAEAFHVTKQMHSYLEVLL